MSVTVEDRTPEVSFTAHMQMFAILNLCHHPVGMAFFMCSSVNLWPGSHKCYSSSNLLLVEIFTVLGKEKDTDVFHDEAISRPAYVYRLCHLLKFRLSVLSMPHRFEISYYQLGSVQIYRDVARSRCTKCWARPRDKALDLQALTRWPGWQALHTIGHGRCWNRAMQSATEAQWG